MIRTGKIWALPLFVLFAISILGILTPETLQTTNAAASVPGDVAWMLTATAMVLFMTPGLAFFYGGMVQKKNVISTMLQSFICMGVISILWVVVGFSLAFGDSINGLIGNPLTYFMFKGVGASTHPTLSPTIPLALFALFQLKFAIITPALITGAFAERVRFSSYLLFVVLFSLFIYAPLAHMTWHPDGMFRKWGVLDFAGGTVVHMSAGFSALAGAMFFGRRKVHLDSELQAPANVPFILLGTGMLWFGWFGFNAGSALTAGETAVMAFLTTNSASATAMLTWLFFDAYKNRKPSAVGASIGAVVGMVAITPAAGYVSVGSSLFIGFAAAVVSNVAVHIRTKTSIDDTLDVFPCHGVGGITGMIMTGIFAKDVGLAFGHSGVFLHHLLALGLVSVFSFFGSALLYKVTNFIHPLRVSDVDEGVGLDLSQHSEAIA